jgi:sirohydrochlorin ferrochelatase
MTALLVAAHGSRQALSNEEVERLTVLLRDRAGQRFSAVAHGFLELASPTFEEAIERCVERGASRIVVLPYFLAAGHHVVRDLPERVEAKRRAHPAVAIEIAPYLGTAEGLADVLLSLVPDDVPEKGGRRTKE